MAEWLIDPRNPGEVLACAGIAHLAWRAGAAAATGFVEAGEGRVRFVAPPAPPPLEALHGATLEPVDESRNTHCVSAPSRSTGGARGDSTRGSSSGRDANRRGRSTARFAPPQATRARPSG